MWKELLIPWIATAKGLSVVKSINCNLKESNSNWELFKCSTFRSSWPHSEASQLLNFSQPATQSVNQSVSQSVRQPVSHSVSQPASQSVSQPFSQPVKQSVSQSASQSVSQCFSQSVSRSVGQSVYQPIIIFISSIINPAIRRWLICYWGLLMKFGTFFGVWVNPLLAAIKSRQATGHNDKTRHWCWKSVLSS